MSDEAACAHLHISYRTEPAGIDGTRGWWECDSGCGASFAPVPKLLEHTCVIGGPLLTFVEVQRQSFPNLEHYCQHGTTCVPGGVTSPPAVTRSGS